jgi:site-specific DNA-cytosine methylase
MNKTYSALFAGFDGAGHGLQSAGLQALDLFEIDPRLAEVGQANTKGRYVVADVCDVDFTRYERPDVLWASPICKNFSVAKANGEESGIDMATAQATCRAIEAWTPEVFLLENVWGYRNSESFGYICHTLNRLGYMFSYSHENSANYGVPQTRCRLILRAVRDRLLPPLPPRTPWHGWYEAIEDLIPSLPESQFAPWQLERLGSFAPSGDFLQMSMATSTHPETRGNGVKQPVEPSGTVTTASGCARAFLMGDRERQVRAPSQPAVTVRAGENGGMVPRAFIVSGTEQRNMKPHYADEPIWSQTAAAGYKGPSKAFIVDGKPANYAGELSITGSGEPVPTITASQPRHPFRAWLEQGRVVKMTPRALCRFQSIPDSFTLSGKAQLDCTGIGNSVPPLLAQRVYESLQEAA